MILTPEQTYDPQAYAAALRFDEEREAKLHDELPARPTQEQLDAAEERRFQLSRAVIGSDVARLARLIERANEAWVERGGTESRAEYVAAHLLGVI